MNYISTTAIFKKAWGTVKANLLKFVGATVIFFTFQFIFSSFKELTFVVGLISLFMGVAVTTALIRIARGAPVTLQTLSISLSQVFRFIGVVVSLILIMTVFVLPIVGTAVILGITSFVGNTNSGVVAFVAILVAAVILIIYVNIRLMFAKYIVLDGDTGVFPALKKSWNITSGHVWTVLKLGLLSAVAVLCMLFVGPFIVFPVIVFAYTYLYIELSSQKEKIVLGLKENE